MALQLQDVKVPIQPLILLDGSNKFVNTHTVTYRQLLNIHDDNRAEAIALSSFADKFGLDAKVRDLSGYAWQFNEKLHFNRNLLQW